MERLSRVQELKIMELVLQFTGLASSNDFLEFFEEVLTEKYKVSKTPEELQKKVCLTIYYKFD